MTKRQFCVELSDRTGVDLRTAMALFEAHEDLVMEIIATEDEISFSWGKIFGFFKDPQKVYGYYAEKEGVKARGGWSVAKSGLPGIDWSYDAKAYTAVDPTELYCEWEEAKFTTKAREYRKDRGLPEIPEYANLPENYVLSLCAKADEKRYGKKTKKQIKEETQQRIKRTKTSNTRNFLIKLEWCDEQVSKGRMTRKEAEKVPMSVIIEQRREEWQDLIRRYEENPLSFFAKDEDETAEQIMKRIGKLNPYEIYKDSSMADYYKKILEDNNLSEDELVQYMKRDIDDMADEILETEAKKSGKVVETKDIDNIAEDYSQYDEEGYRVDENGQRIQYWQTWK